MNVTKEELTAIAAYADAVANSASKNTMQAAERMWRITAHIARAELARMRCECSATGPVCAQHSPADTYDILPRCECGHTRDCHKEEA